MPPLHSSRLLVTMVVPGVLLPLLVSAVNSNDTGLRKAWACYGNYHNFLDVRCPPDRQVALVSMMNGAKPTSQQCPSMTTNADSFRQECCTFSEGDCVIQTHRNSLPTECFDRHFCKPQSRLADTSPQCNSDDFPKYTHYTEIQYRCIVPPSTPSTTTTTDVTGRGHNSSVIRPSNRSLIPESTASGSVNTTTTTTTTTSDATTTVGDSHPYTVHQTSSPNSQDGGDLTPAMIGGMIAGIVGLMLTIFIFIFYWGRKRRVRIAGKAPSNSVWDFLLSNTMSVRAFRGYDNFSSSSSSANRHSRNSAASSDDGSPVMRGKTMWLPTNIILDNSNNINGGVGDGGYVGGGRDSIVTTDDNCSVATVERSDGGGGGGGGVWQLGGNLGGSATATTTSTTAAGADDAVRMSSPPSSPLPLSGDIIINRL